MKRRIILFGVFLLLMAQAHLFAEKEVLLTEDFSEGVPPLGWYVDGQGEDNWVSLNNFLAGGEAPEMSLTWTPVFWGTSRMCTMTINTEEMTGLLLEFKNFLSDFEGGYTIGVSTSSDGVNWNSVWSYNAIGNDIYPNTMTIPINTIDVGSQTFQLCFEFVGGSMCMTQWIIDDVCLSGYNGSETATLDGQVTLSGNNGNVEDVEITVGSQTINPDEEGDYSVLINSGLYDITAYLENYLIYTKENVIIEDASILDITLYEEISPLYPPDSLYVDCQTGEMAWRQPNTGNTYELYQHDNVWENAWNEILEYGYGVIFDLSNYQNVSLEMLDFRHSSWDVTGIWDYNLHIVDWDTYTEIATISNLQTTGDDKWEEGILLGSISASGLVGMFLEPLSFDVATNCAYPVLDGDNSGPSGLSIFGQLDDYSAMSLSVIVGDFLMNLWIKGFENGASEFIKVPCFTEKLNDARAKIEHGVQDFAPLYPQQSSKLYKSDNSKEFLGYNVYLNYELQGNTFNCEWQLIDLVASAPYVAGVSALYDAGESEIKEYDFIYSPPSIDDENPSVSGLHGSFPNPFKQSTTISFSIQHQSKVKLDIYNLRGQKVKTLVSGELPGETYEYTWDGTDESNNRVVQGVYFYKLQTDHYIAVNKMLMIK